MQRWYVYILQTKNGKRYIGLSCDADRRLDEHNKGLSLFTKRYVHWKRIYLQEFETYTEARKRELYLKKQKGGNGLKKILENTKNHNEEYGS